MDVGIELDARIAEKIFGYRLDYEFADMMFEGRPCVKELRTQDDEWGMLPLYSEDIAATLTAAEYMHQRYGCAIELKIMPPFMPGRKYAALICGGDGLAYPRADITAYGYSATSLAHALCLALLKPQRDETVG